MTLGIKVLRAYPHEIEHLLDDYSRQEMTCPDAWKEKIIKMSAGVWLISYQGDPLVIIGVIRTSMIGTGAEVWFLTFKKARQHRKDLIRFCRKGRDRLLRCYGFLQVRTEEGFRENARFVEFFGFRPNGTSEAITGQKFTLYEMRPSWL